MSLLMWLTHYNLSKILFTFVFTSLILIGLVSCATPPLSEKKVKQHSNQIIVLEPDRLKIWKAIVSVMKKKYTLDIEDLTYGKVVTKFIDSQEQKPVGNNVHLRTIKSKIYLNLIPIKTDLGKGFKIIAEKRAWRSSDYFTTQTKIKTSQAELTALLYRINRVLKLHQKGLNP